MTTPGPAGALPPPWRGACGGRDPGGPGRPAGRPLGPGRPRSGPGRTPNPRRAGLAGGGSCVWGRQRSPRRGRRNRPSRHRDPAGWVRARPPWGQDRRRPRVHRQGLVVAVHVVRVAPAAQHDGAEHHRRRGHPAAAGALLGRRPRPGGSHASPGGRSVMNPWLTTRHRVRPANHWNLPGLLHLVPDPADGMPVYPAGERRAISRSACSGSCRSNAASLARRSADT